MGATDSLFFNSVSDGSGPSSKAASSAANPSKKYDESRASSPAWDPPYDGADDDEDKASVQLKGKGKGKARAEPATPTRVEPVTPSKPVSERR
jgi:hypothetical protein